ncbi:hypothetical protein NPIL_412031 [Nephila pilipes]|uniref:Uncharacterized protein n=1 Tax=Nephila pilipes TaxID=299642 RepID=A0A8X6TQU8_NEPPI|nr:hypothetical protein NPIL_412031 [Nephila pilipes]
MQTLLQNSEDGHNFPLTTLIVKEDFYVANVLSGVRTLPECTEMQQQLPSMLNRAGMKLYEWRVIELHYFCDASEAAFGAVVYCKSQTLARDVASKSRVTPLKKITVPRLDCTAFNTCQVDATNSGGSSIGGF